LGYFLTVIIFGLKVARELRLRDIGGIIVVDFVGMTDICKLLRLQVFL
jgi:Ribonuclease G/E